MGSRDTTQKQKPHVVCVPFPLQGHINPFMQLAKQLHCNGFHITFVHSELNHNRLIRSQGPQFLKRSPDFQFKTISDGLPPPSDSDATQDVIALSDSTRKHCYAPFKELVIKLNSSVDLPKISCIIADAITGFAVRVANDLGIPVVRYSTNGACGFLGFLQLEELVVRGILPFKDDSFLTDGTLDKPVDWLPGVKHIRLKDLPNCIRVTNLDDITFDCVRRENLNCLSSPAIIFNTFQELEPEFIDIIKAKNPNVYTIGPLQLLGRQFQEREFKPSESSLWKNDSKCIQWLDQWTPSSVIYVNFGSIAFMSEQHFEEFAWGLANSKNPFLWIVRPDVVMGESANLPPEFVGEVKDRGYITSWCPQAQVLAHPSIGVFLTHCGWNSVIESICEGVPMICWPFFSDQLINTRLACKNWGIGMEISHDVKREEIAALVKEIMEGEMGMQIRSESLKWKKEAIKATNIGESSYNNFKRLIKEALHHDG